MPDTKITALTALTTADPATDMFPIVDVSDTTMAASGTTKRISINNILACSPTATLASATITGDLTVDTNVLKVDTANNRVGIRNASPTQILSINGDTFVSSPFNGIALGDNAAERLRIGYKDGTPDTGLVPAQIVTQASVLQIATRDIANGAITLHTGTGVAERFRIAGDGVATWSNVGGVAGTAMTLNSTGLGVGVTPSAWGNYKVLEVGTTSSLYNDGGVATDLSNNMYINSSFAYIRKIAAAATRYEQNAGAHAWYNAASSTAGSAITFTQAMTLDASGNLLVGTTSNANTARAYFRYDTLTIQPVINSASIVAASTSWNHFIGQSGNGSTVTTNNIFIRGNGDIINANGIYGTISDLRLKENIADARNYLSDLLKLRVVKYSLKEEDSAVANKLGFIAQEVEQVFPKMVDTDSEDTKSIKISLLIPMLVKAIQELTARVQTLEAR
jgi:hypothetical protein